MITTKLSSKGQVIIPKPVRMAHRWLAGQELIIVDTEEGILLKPKPAFEQKNAAEVAGCLRYRGPPKTLEDMEEGIRRGTKASFS